MSPSTSTETTLNIQNNSVKSKKEAAKSSAKNRKTTQSLAQGLSVAEASILNENPWGFSLSTSAGRGGDEYADTWSSSTALDMSYTLDKKSALGVSVGYDTVLYSFDGKLFNNSVNDPSQYGVSDIELSYSRPNIWSDKYNRLVMTGALTFPTSKVSQRASLVLDGNVNFALRYTPLSRVIITPSMGLYARSYRYETANAMGFQANSPYGYSYGVAGSYIFLSWLTGTLGYNQVQRYDYFGDWRTIQSASAQLSFAIADTMTAFTGYRWRDRTISNDSVFDDDKSSIYIGVSYAF